jgi:hypothetical protein
MMMLVRGRAAIAVAVLVVGMSAIGAACGRDDGALGIERELGELPAAPVLEIVIARESIVAARCDLEARCDNIGKGRQFVSRDVCTSELRTQWSDELNLAECPGGVDTEELNECLQEIRNEDCNDPFDTLGRVAACRSSDLCRAFP